MRTNLDGLDHSGMADQIGRPRCETPVLTKAERRSRSGRARWPSLLLLVPLLLGGCRGEAPVYTTSFDTLGHLGSLSLVGIDIAVAEAISCEIKHNFAFITEHWQTKQQGPMARVNHLLRQGEPFIAPPSILPLVRLGQKYAELTGGLLNPAMGGLIALWGFHGPSPRAARPPSGQEINRLVSAAPSMDAVRIDGLILASTSRAVQLDFEGLVTGYGIDLAIDYLREQGIDNAMLRIGNDLRAIGDRAGKPWRVAILRPSGSGVYGFVEISGNASVFTTGDYERSFFFNGRTYHHLIDPRTGKPADATRAVTVIHPDAVTADAAARALFIAGPAQWWSVAAAMGVKQVLLFDRAGVAHMSPSMAERLEPLEDNPIITISAPLSDPAISQEGT